jgi:hypothetical protein
MNNDIDEKGQNASSGNLHQISDEELITFLNDEDEKLKSRLENISPETYKQFSLQSVNVKQQGEFIASELATPMYLPKMVALPGISFRVLRKNQSHNDPNTGEIFTPIGSREFGYSSNNSVGDLFQTGSYDIRVRVNRPFWVGIGKVTYHTRVELFFDAGHWTPGGVAWWGEVWGWYGTGVGSTLQEWTIRITLS